MKISAEMCKGIIEAGFTSIESLCSKLGNIREVGFHVGALIKVLDSSTGRTNVAIRRP